MYGVPEEVKRLQEPCANSGARVPFYPVVVYSREAIRKDKEQGFRAGRSLQRLELGLLSGVSLCGLLRWWAGSGLVPECAWEENPWAALGRARRVESICSFLSTLSWTHS